MTDEYAHYYFFETCNDDDYDVMRLVEKMFSEINALPEGNVWLIRFRPVIQRGQIDFESGKRLASVGFRFSVKIGTEPELPQLVGVFKPPE